MESRLSKDQIDAGLKRIARFRTARNIALTALVGGTTAFATPMMAGVGIVGMAASMVVPSVAAIGMAHKLRTGFYAKEAFTRSRKSLE